MQKCILVLSNPRSGSSATTGCLHLCGIPLGKSVTTVKDQFNAKGYFENQKILNFNANILNNLGLEIHNPLELNKNQIENLLKSKEELKEIIIDEYSDYNIFAIKDPRIVIIWDLYNEVIKELNIFPKIIKLTRNINAIAPSVNRMNAIPIEKSMKMTRNYYKLIDKISHDKESITISFEDLLEQPVETTKKMCCFAGIGFGDSKEASIQHFIDRNLVNFK